MILACTSSLLAPSSASLVLSFPKKFANRTRASAQQRNLGPGPLLQLESASSQLALVSRTLKS